MTVSGIILHVYFSLRNMKSVEIVCMFQFAFTWHVYVEQINEMYAELSLSFLCAH